MLKRTKGHLLLTLLVITGLAGTLNNSTLSQKERKYLVTSLKDSRTEILEDMKDLSEAQVNFRPAAGQPNIKECFYRLNLIETNLWSILETTMKTAPIPERRGEIRLRDEDLAKAAMARDNRDFLPATFTPGRPDWKSMDEAIDAFKTMRSHHFKYVKTTTEDLRNHLLELPAGWIDCYQFLVFISSYSDRCLQQVREIKAHAGYPARQAKN